ncbi:MAG: hypothetical protein P1U67_13570 [Alcanivoracaceae bacterium]|nr:hypothetical protein [Alcanivoracaceae bacterium]
MTYAGILLSFLMLVFAMPVSAEKGSGMMKMDQEHVQASEHRSEMEMTKGGKMEMSMMHNHMKGMQQQMKLMMSGEGNMETRMDQTQAYMQNMQVHMEMMQRVLEQMSDDQ